jgi:serine/threonine protein kinase
VAARLTRPPSIGPVEQTSTGSGVVLDGRYRLERVRANTVAAQRQVAVWDATDTSLERALTVLTVTGRTKKLRREIAAAATRASRVTDGRCVRVLDVGETDVEGDPVTWVATERVDGPTLTETLRHRPLPAPVAVEVVKQCALALAAAQNVGCRHGRLDPDDVILPPDGGLPRIAGLEIDAAIDPWSDDAAAKGADDDVRALAALLFAALTGRWPLPGWRGLPRTEYGDAVHPRASVSSVPKEVDDVTARGLSGAFHDVSDFARALSRLPSRPLDAPAPPPADDRLVAVRRWLWRLVPPLLVLVLAASGWVVGSDLGRVPQSARSRHAALPPVAATTPRPGAITLVWSTPPQATGFDPEGDGEENNDAAGFAVDHDATTSWTTDLYQHSSHFGGLKSGVGLLIDLGRPASVSVADVLLTAPGADVELRAGDPAPTKASDLRLLESAAPAGAHPVWRLPSPVVARYWLIWFTNLPKAGGGYRIGITDISLLGRTGG